MELKYQWNIIGHRKQLVELEQDLESSNVSHAYLFAGPAQIGKFSILKMLAKIVQCENNFCHACSNCVEIEKGYHADTIEMFDDGETLKIEQVRELLNRLHTTTQSRYKVVLLQNIERMTPESANALLKTLEDPPPQVKFLMTTGNLKALLPTIVSRVRLYKFSNLSEEDLRGFLQKNYPEHSSHDLQTVSALALGKPGKALTLLKDSELLQRYKDLYHQLVAMMEKSDHVARFSLVSGVGKETKDETASPETEDFLNVFMALARQHLLQIVAAEGKESHEIDQALLRKRVDLLKDLQQAKGMLKRNVNTRLVLENLMLAL